MLQHVNRLDAKILICLVLLGITIYFIYLKDISSTAKAQDSVQNMRRLLERLNSEEVTMLFHFHTPLVADEVYWSIPDLNEDDYDNISRFIFEIGDDYICFDELAGQAYTISCTPFANIVSISYLSKFGR